MSHRSPSPFDRLLPVSDRYATLPVAEAFTWDACEADVQPGDVCRVGRRDGADQFIRERRTDLDHWSAATLEAAADADARDIRPPVRIRVYWRDPGHSRV